MSAPYHHRLPDGVEWVIFDRVIYGASEQIAAWVNVRLDGEVTRPMFSAVGVLRPGVDPTELTYDNLPSALAGGAVFFNRYEEDGWSDITVSVAFDDPLANHPDVVARVLWFPFEQWKMRRVSAEIDVGNERSIRVAEAIGFQLEGIKENMCADGRGLAIYGLLPERCQIWQRRKDYLNG